jgi:hypothetical protein
LGTDWRFHITSGVKRYHWLLESMSYYVANLVIHKVRSCHICNFKCTSMSNEADRVAEP